MKIFENYKSEYYKNEINADTNIAAISSLYSKPVLKEVVDFVLAF